MHTYRYTFTGFFSPSVELLVEFGEIKGWGETEVDLDFDFSRYNIDLLASMDDVDVGCHKASQTEAVFGHRIKLLLFRLTESKESENLYQR